MTEKLTKYAIIDLEATNAGSDARIIQIGIVIVEDKKIINSFQTDINPHSKLSEHIKSLTGITDQQLATAPEFSQVAGEIFELIKDCVFVAHNVKFDANLLSEALFFEGFDLLTPRVDTVELAQVFFPNLEKYNLGHLAKNMDLNLSHAHTAISDALATAKLFIKIQKKIESLPRETLEMMAVFADSLIFESGQLITQALSKAKSYDRHYYNLVEGILLPKKQRTKKAKKLSQDFSINTAILGLEDRPLQNDFAALIEAGLNHSEPSFIQAQAGIGKSYGYLLPLLAKTQDQQILASVPTKILQDQMTAKELATIEAIFQIDCHSLKGPANYIKLDLFHKSLQQVEDNRLVNRYKLQLLVWLLETKTGDLDEIKQKQRYAAFFDTIQHDGDLNHGSPFYDYDYWRYSYEKGKRAKVLLTNHAYFLHRIEDDKAFARDKILVFDEAQRLLLQLDQLSRKQINLQQLLQDLTRALETPQSLVEKRLLESLIFELNDMATSYLKKRPYEASNYKVSQKLSDLVKELDGNRFPELSAIFKYADTDYWFSSEHKEEKRVIYLNASTQRFINFQHLLPEIQKSFFISATLAISQRVNLAYLLGFENYSFAKIDHVKSKQQKIMIDQEMPIISEVNEKDYCQAIAKRIYALSQEKLPILVLFNSRSHLFLVSDILEEWNLAHLAQEKSGTAYNIKKRFDRGEQSILLGMGAFWEGVDFVQADRMIEVITKLPFDNPQDLYVKKMSAYLLEKQKNPFIDYFLPMAILKLKQAIGRTMRRENQKSLILLLDKRVMTKSYGPEVLANLSEEFLISCETFENCLLESRQFLL
ncbi:bifunctional DnaQ family exonuclease/ATP-dependent helicase [Streptococcus porcinus]|uniref:bifunctional DnaQ family exonuclease/ATP-dependent helicase n=1 Tax=Streptococcus porcinus TaxID=1340 RepID=UPI0019617A19|nr:bifunctional DnaQ family exonuclease/ATP-dependent helicase [Streptococcus porcinus]